MFKVICRYQYSNWGWTELYWRTTGITFPFVGVPKDFIDARVAILENGCRFVSMSVIDEDVPNAGRPYAVNREGEFDGDISGLAGQGTNYPNNALKIIMNGVGGHSRFLWLRGIPQGMVGLSDNGETDIAGTYLGLVEAFCAILPDWCALRVLIDENTLPWIPLFQLEKGITGFTRVITFPHTWEVDDIIYFRGVDECLFPGLRGQHRIIIGGPDTFVVQQVWPDDIPAQPQAAPAAVREVQYEAEDIEEPGQIGGMSSHKTGRPTNLPRGRSRGLRCRRSRLAG